MDMVVSLEELLESYRNMNRQEERKMNLIEGKFRIKDIIDLNHIYGANTTLGDLVRAVQGNKIYKCPCCNGEGYVLEEYDKNIANGGSYEPGYKEVTCKLCDGYGYTEKQYRPKMVQDGWEEV